MTHGSSRNFCRHFPGDVISFWRHQQHQERTQIIPEASRSFSGVLKLHTCTPRGRTWCCHHHYHYTTLIQPSFNHISTRNYTASSLQATITGLKKQLRTSKSYCLLSCGMHFEFALAPATTTTTPHTHCQPDPATTALGLGKQLVLTSMSYSVLFCTKNL